MIIVYLYICIFVYLNYYAFFHIINIYLIFS